MKIKKILVPIDFSKCSINALKIIANIAKEQGASLELVNAIHIPAYPHAEVIAAGIITQPILVDYEKQVQRQFDELPNEVPKLKDLVYTTRKLISPIGNAIQSCLENDNIDLIAMGTSGNHDKFEKFIGTVSSDVIRISKVPVLIIPADTLSLNINRIGFTADLQKIKDIKKLEVLTFFAKLTGAEINIFHLSSDNDDESLFENTPEKMNLLDSFSEVKHTYTWINNNNAPNGILDFIESHQLDMLAMYPRQYGFWNRLFHNSLTKKIAVEIKVPLLTIHE